MLRLAILALMLLTIGCTTLTTADIDIEETVDTAVASALAEQKVVSAPGDTTASGAVPLPEAIASRTFIKLGDVKGESTDTDHRGEIDVLAWSWGVTVGTTGTDSAVEATTDSIGTREGEVTPTESTEVQRQEFKLTKHIDKASPKLFQALANGTVTPEMQLTVRNEAEGQARTEHMIIVMTNVIVTSINSGGGGDDRPTETVTLNFTEIEWTYIEQDSSGAPVGDPTGFDLELRGASHDTAMGIIRNMR
jgi:type VI secretion system secreted protein Hcp